MSEPVWQPSKRLNVGDRIEVDGVAGEITATTQTLAQWLTAQLDADEALANEARDDALAFETYPRYYKLGSSAGELARRFDPARVLATVAAHRRIVEMHRPFRYADDPPAYGYTAEEAQEIDAEDVWRTDSCCTCGTRGEYDVDWPCPTLCALAAIYADRDGYREEWR